MVILLFLQYPDPEYKIYSLNRSAEIHNFNCI